MKPFLSDLASQTGEHGLLPPWQMLTNLYPFLLPTNAENRIALVREIICRSWHFRRIRVASFSTTSRRLFPVGLHACSHLAKYDEDAPLRPTILSIGDQWIRTTKNGLLSPLTTDSIFGPEKRKIEKNRAYDLIDSLTNSGRECHVAHVALHSWWHSPTDHRVSHSQVCRSRPCVAGLRGSS